jgi:hypothetical protein
MMMMMVMVMAMMANEQHVCKLRIAVSCSVVSSLSGRDVVLLFCQFFSLI